MLPCYEPLISMQMLPNSPELNMILLGGIFTWPIQDDQMNMTKIGEHDQKIHPGEC